MNDNIINEALNPPPITSTPPPLQSPSPSLQQPVNSDSANNSGSGDETVIPDEIKGWSWGGFLWTWIWAIGNKTWIGLLGLISPINLIVAIVLGIKGREWAWQNKKWDSIAAFKKTQRNWAKWWLIIILPLFTLSMFGILFTVVLTAINPNEQIRRATDARTKNNSAQILVAVEKYYATNNSFPWNGSNNKPEDFYYTDNLVSESWLTKLVDGDELSQGAVARFQKSKSITILYKEVGMGGDINVCFKPESQTDKTLASQNCQNKVYKQALFDYACVLNNEMICIP
ncbi:MAG: hypothetical protein US68_C0018G0014 [Candidatus Shapirobacteria bacterium GW2011_GWE1_38_10]|uniref:Uncharacterized protein n=1 Tax=Candidatus Shapirobacteria bacterium GW2011_GWE1_38_10 TaxID=1618488 RepID=A0A0G0I1I5_9BACT|nr:MAG: hypothetical protein US68_C0018G0014 [Candidatus Shapirobacteria bacterium GW2011_GWE1_38_10]